MPLMSAVTLAALEDLPRICDTRWYLDDPDLGWHQYREAHIPGAVFVDLETVLTGSRGPGRHPLPAPEDFCDDLGHLGITPDTHVVAYDGSGGSIAARMWWMLRSIGHHRVSVLDGGIEAWIRHGLPVTAGPTELNPTTYPRVTRWSGTVDRRQVEAAIGTGRLLDARAPERFRGEFEPIDPRAGHIPSAVNLPYAGNLNHNGTFRSSEELAERFASLPPAPIAYCGSGITACHDLLAMEIAGIEGGLLYEGSWSDWAGQAHLPAETGP
jgi:thiosulfate/3-mercaptopyruvate sulfurtransferase